MDNAISRFAFATENLLLKSSCLDFCTCTLLIIIVLQMTGGNDISLIYPWVNINDITQDIWSWLDREEEKKEKQFADELMSASMSLDTVSLVKNISCDNPGNREYFTKHFWSV